MGDGRRRRRRLVALMLGLALVAGACGTQPEEAIDSRPVQPPPDGLPPDQHQLRLVAALHGPTDDLSGRLGTLVPFPDLPTPAEARVLGIGAGTTSRPNDRWYEVAVTLTAGGTSDELALFFETSLNGSPWALTERRNGRTIHDEDVIEMVFERDDKTQVRPDSVAIDIVDDPDLDAIRIDLHHIDAAFDPAEHRGADMLQPWFQDWHDLPLPPGGRPTEYSWLRTYGASGRTVITLRRGYTYDEPPFDDDNELQAWMGDRASEAGLVSRRGRGPLNAGRYEIDDPSFGTFIVAHGRDRRDEIWVTGEARFTTPRSAGAAEQDVATAAVPSTEPLPPRPSIEDIERVVNDMHGPTLDVGAQMRRLVPFPDLRTPNGASIEWIDAGVQPINASRFDDLPRPVPLDGRVASFGRAVIEVDGTFDDVEALYLTDIAGRGWTEVGERQDREDDGASVRRRIDYDIDDVGNGNQGRLRLTIDGDVDLTRTVVDLGYVEFVAADEADLERFASWAGVTPTPPGGRLDTATVRTAPVSDDVVLEVGSRYDDGYDEEGSLFAATLDAIDGSDYTVPDGETPSGTTLDLERPGLTRASVYVGTVGYSADLADRVAPEIRDRRAVTVTGVVPLVRGGSAETARQPTADGDTDAGSVDGEVDEREMTDVAGGLRPKATLDELRTVISEVSGPTDDASGQLLRIGRFPDLPTPLGTTIVSFQLGLSVRTGEDRTNHYGSTLLDVNGPDVDVDQVTTFYRAQIASNRWDLVADETVVVDGARRTTFEFERSGVEPGSGPPTLKLTITDDPVSIEGLASGGRLVEGVAVAIDYAEILPTDEFAIDRLVGWPGDAPIPPGGEPIGAWVTGRLGGRPGVAVDSGHSVEYRYERPAPEVDAEMRALIGRGDYRRAEEQPADGDAVRVTRPPLPFFHASITVSADGPGTTLRFDGSGPLE